MWAACFLDLSGLHIFICAESGTFSIFNHIFSHRCISSSAELGFFLFVLHLSRVSRLCFSFDFHIHVFCFSQKTYTVLHYTVQLGPYLFKYRFQVILFMSASPVTPQAQSARSLTFPLFTHPTKPYHSADNYDLIYIVFSPVIGL